MFGTAAKYRKSVYIPIPGPSDGEIRVHRQSVREAVHQLVDAFEVSAFVGILLPCAPRSAVLQGFSRRFTLLLLPLRLQRDKKQSVVLSGLAQAFGTVVAAVEAAKRRVPGLHQVSTVTVVGQVPPSWHAVFSILPTRTTPSLACPLLATADHSSWSSGDIGAL